MAVSTPVYLHGLRKNLEKAVSMPPSGPYSLKYY
jgi:hypothetical protein